MPEVFGHLGPYKLVHGGTLLARDIDWIFQQTRCEAHTRGRGPPRGNGARYLTVNGPLPYLEYALHLAWQCITANGQKRCHEEKQMPSAKKMPSPPVQYVGKREQTLRDKAKEDDQRTWCMLEKELVPVVHAARDMSNTPWREWKRQTTSSSKSNFSYKTWNLRSPAGQNSARACSKYYEASELSR